MATERLEAHSIIEYGLDAHAAEAQSVKATFVYGDLRPTDDPILWPDSAGHQPVRVAVASRAVSLFFDNEHLGRPQLVEAEAPIGEHDRERLSHLLGEPFAAEFAKAAETTPRNLGLFVLRLTLEQANLIQLLHLQSEQPNISPVTRAHCLHYLRILQRHGGDQTAM